MLERGAGICGGRGILLAQYALDLQENLPDRHATQPGLCPCCRTHNGRGVWILAKGAIHCPSCAPLKRKCATCEKSYGIEHFDVTRKRMTLNSYCVSCRRAKARKQYDLAQSSQTAIATEAKCVDCGVVKPAAQFYVDKRYATGLTPSCRKCKNAFNAEYQREHPRGR
jgi:hypothetical protein